MDPTTPRILRIAGDTNSARGLAEVMSAVTTERYKAQWVGNIAMLSGAFAKRLAPQANDAFPVWQGMQYMRDQFSGRAQHDPLDNARYLDLSWTTVNQMMGVVRRMRTSLRYPYPGLSTWQRGDCATLRERRRGWL